jgi:hypothetical protein
MKLIEHLSFAVHPGESKSGNQWMHTSSEDIHLELLKALKGKALTDLYNGISKSADNAQELLQTFKTQFLKIAIPKVFSEEKAQNNPRDSSNFNRG